MGLRPSPMCALAPVALCLLAASTLRAQDMSPPPVPLVTWQLSAGYNTFALRDAARTGRPVDGSPVSWIGSGPTFLVAWERGRPDRTHRVEAVVSGDGDFAYDTSISRVARPSSESARQLVARYEYVRYPKKLTVAGLSFGIGVAGAGERWTISRDSESVAQQEHGASADVASILAVRTRYWDRVEVAATWFNAMRILHVDVAHEPDTAGEYASWGGGWSTEWSALANIRVAGKARVRVAYSSTGYGNISSHHNYTVEGRRLVMGVSYGR